MGSDSAVKRQLDDYECMTDDMRRMADEGYLDMNYRARAYKEKQERLIREKGCSMSTSNWRVNEYRAAKGDGKGDMGKSSYKGADGRVVWNRERGSPNQQQQQQYGKGDGTSGTPLRTTGYSGKGGYSGKASGKTSGYGDRDRGFSDTGKSPPQSGLNNRESCDASSPSPHPDAFKPR